MGIAAHDLKNPLTTVQRSADLLARSELDERQHAILDRIQLGVRQLLDALASDPEEAGDRLVRADLGDTWERAQALEHRTQGGLGGTRLSGREGPHCGEEGLVRHGFLEQGLAQQFAGHDRRSGRQR